MQEIKQRNKSTSGNIPEKSNVRNENEKNIVRNHGQQSSSTNISLKVFSRAIVITSLLIVVYFSSKNDKMKIFARQSDLLAGKGQILDCSPNYLKDMYKYEGCFPKECKRFVTDKVISPKEADELLLMAQKEFQYVHDSNEGITTLDLDSGALSNGQHSSNIYQNKESRYSSSDLNIFRVVKEKIKYAIVHHFGVEPRKIFLTRPALLTRIKPFSSDKATSNLNEYWHPRVDNDVDKSYHFTASLFLGDYNKDFKGGRFIFVDDMVNKSIEPRRSRLSMFTSGGENRYYVEKVTSGIKYTVTFFFTCDKNYAIEDPNINKYLN